MPVAVVSASIGSEYWPPALAGNAPKTGATLAMVTPIESVFDSALSESLTWTLTVELAGPSGKVHLKLPAPVATVEGEVREGSVVAAALAHDG